MLTRWWVRMAIVAVAYIVAGRLAMLLAIPPGYATAIWPAAAIAVIAVWRWGWPAAVGVAIGSFTVNLSSTGGLSVGAALALGPALQAALAASLIRRWIGPALALERGREIAKFYLLAGPVACLVAATWGAIVLYGAGATPASDLVYTWLTWWVGDTVGVMLVSPIILVAVGKPRAMWRARWLSVGVPLTIVTIGLMLAYVNATRYERGRATQELELRATAITSAISQRVDRYSDAVQSMASFLSANRTLGKEQFATFASGTFGRDRDIQALAWAPRVTPATRDTFEIAARSELGDFQILERGGGGLVRAADRPEMFPALYAEPLGRQHGFDLASDPTRFEAIRRAHKMGEATATSPLVLLHGDPGFLIVAPVFTRDAEPVLYGVAAGGFSTSALIQSATTGFDTRDLDIAITDVTRIPIVVSGAPRDGGFVREVPIAGRTWRFAIARTGPSVRGWQAWFALVRLAVVGFLGLVLLALTGGRTRIAQAERRNLDEILLAESDHVFQLELGDLLHSSESVRAVLARSAVRISEHLDLDKCHFAEIDIDDAQVVVHQYTRGKKKESDEIAPLASFEAAGLGELTRGTRYVIPDVSKDERTAELYETAYEPRSIRAFVAIPLMRGGVCVAYFGAVSATPRDWTQREVSLFQSVAERTWLWAEHLRSLHGLRANESQLRDLSRYLEARVDERTQDLLAAVGEKEALIKEIHHRVKNNLQVISSMLNLQARRITDVSLKDVFDESQQRIQTIALVHERLYQSRDLSNIGFDDYLKSLVANVMSAQNAAARNVTATTEVENVSLPIQTAIPCGLIVNELVTNALKHAFPDGRTGTIAVSMKPAGDHVELSVSDDGVGLPTTLDPAKAKTLGLDLVYTFAEQLDATVDVRSTTKGAMFTLRFPGA